MINYVKINGVNSNTINGLGINELPPITKPPLRVLQEQIDGRDGDITTDLGYGAYDKTITIGLFGTGYDINSIISFFNGEGTIVFSNEPDKYYKYKIVNQIDYVALQKFKSASITFHCQPFKYPLEETPLEIEYEYVEQTGVETSSLTPTTSAPMSISLKGNTSQTGEPTPSSPIPVNVVSGDNTINVCGKNRLKTSLEIMKAKNTAGTWNNNVYTYRQVNFTVNDDLSITINGTATGGRADFFLFGGTTDTGNYIYIPQGTYSVYKTGLIDGTMFMNWREKTAGVKYTTNSNNSAIETMASQDCYFYAVMLGLENNKSMNNYTFYPMLVSGSTLGEYEPYQSQTYPINLGELELCKTGDYQDYFTKNSGKNLLSITATTTTIDGITFTINGDGTIKVNGTASAQIIYNINENVVLSGDYYMSGCPSGGGDNTYKLQFYGTGGADDLGNGNQISNVNGIVRIVIRNGVNCNNIVFKPMIEAGTTGTMFEPYGTGQWCKYNAIGKKIFTGDNSEGWELNTAKQYVTQYLCATIQNAVNSTDYTQNSYTNYFKYTQGNPDDSTTNAYYWKFQKRLVIVIQNSLASSVAELQTWLSSHNVEFYYLLATPYLSLIEDNTLINQLDNIQNAMSYNDTTNVSQINNDKPFLMDLKAMKDGTNKVVINNIGNYYAKPTIALEGTGITDIYLNNTEILQVDLTDTNKITIDTANMEAYDPTTNLLANRKVVGNYNSMTLPSGNTTMKITGQLTSATITDYTRWL